MLELVTKIEKDIQGVPIKIVEIQDFKCTDGSASHYEGKGHFKYFGNCTTYFRSLRRL